MSTKTVQEALQYGQNKLKDAKIDSAYLDAEILLCYVLGISREELYKKPETKIRSSKWTKYVKLISKRKKHHPIAYLIGKKEFYGLEFFVNKNVLIPRPETELLVEEVLNYIKNKKLQHINILDIGTGCGCIALTLAKYLPQSKIVAVDISNKALRVAKKNKKKLGIKNVKFKKSNLLQEFKNPQYRKWVQKPDIIVANLPYLTIEELKEKTIKHEPRVALYGGQEGLDSYKKFFCQIQEKKWKNLTIFLEINGTQIEKIQQIIKKYLPKSKIISKKDLAKKDRILIVKI